MAGYRLTIAPTITLFQFKISNHIYVFCIFALMIEEFFSILSERFYNENDLSDFTWAMCQTSDNFLTAFLDIQHINSYHSQLKRFMRGFNGVSTKYLNNYLVWNNLVNYAKESDMEKRNIFLTFVLATLKTAKCRDLSNRPAVPLVA